MNTITIPTTTAAGAPALRSTRTGLVPRIQHHQPDSATQKKSSLSQFILLCLIAFLVGLSSIIPTAEAVLAVRALNASTISHPSWDPFQGPSPHYSLSGVLVLGQVLTNCEVQVVNATAAGQSGRAILAAVDPQHPIVDTILLLRYDWLDYCATFDDIFDKLGSLNTQLRSLSLPEVGAVMMDGNAQSDKDFGSPFIQLANAKHWNSDVHLNISFMGSDHVLSLASLLEEPNSAALLATVVQEDGPWNVLWKSIWFNVVIRGLDALTGLIFVYGLWVLMFIAKAKKDTQHYKRYLILIPGCFYLPLSIAFAPYKVTVPWRNAVYYLCLLFPFISLGLQITMWSTLIYRIKRKKMNKLFAYYSYLTIFVPVISSFLDGIGWLVPSVPVIRIIGEKGFSYVTPAIILVQAGLIFYYATTFFKSLQGVSVSQTTRTALVKITVLNLAMISFFILMLLSRIVSLMGLNMKSRAAYMTELVIFRFSFLFFYAACFRTLSIRQPTGSTVDSKGALSGDGKSGNGNNHSNKNNRSGSKNHTHYPMDNFQSTDSSPRKSSSRNRDQDEEVIDSRPSLHYNKHLSNHASKGFTISDPNSPGRYNTASYGGPTSSASASTGGATPRLTHGYTSSQHQLLGDDPLEYQSQVIPEPYKFNEFGHLTQFTHGESNSPQFHHSHIHPDLQNREEGSTLSGESSYLDIGNTYNSGNTKSSNHTSHPPSSDDEIDKESVYGSHRVHNSSTSKGGPQNFNFNHSYNHSSASPTSMPVQPPRAPPPPSAIESATVAGVGGNGGRVVGGKVRNTEGYARFESP
ncbi:hypothetical protein BGZ83_008673 [Gryganskiella cystojenkinii]|nr:hypothetical protein BGZ83_008673 [Gryganskiella cystojenkinii]